MKLKLTRPNNLEEFIGKEDLKYNLQVYLDAAKQKGRYLDHCLFYGQPGCGKTSLAHIIAHELNCRIRCVQGSNIQFPKDVYNLALSVQPNEIIFLDEIHAINKICFEAFYLLLEDFCLDINIGKDFNTRVTRIKIPQFTMIAATTLLARIPKPMEERFGIVFNLSQYTDSEMRLLVQSATKKINLKLSQENINLIAQCSKGIPRNAINILARIEDFHVANRKIPIAQILQKIGIFKNGLTQDDFIYLSLFQDQNSFLGIKTIVQLTNFDQEYVETRIEPYLLQMKYITKTEKGRKITLLGLEICLKMQDNYW